MSVQQIQRFLFDMVSLSGGFGLAMMISINQAAQNEAKLRDFIGANKRLLDHCYDYESAGTYTASPVGGYRAQCMMDYDGLFVIEDWLDVQVDYPD